jgi:hypothetical protein
MAESPEVSPTSTFVIRFWREWSTTAGHWRGRIEHVQSGQRVNFVELDCIIEFVRGFGIMVEDRISPRQAEE